MKQIRANKALKNQELNQSIYQALNHLIIIMKLLTKIKHINKKI